MKAVNLQFVCIDVQNDFSNLKGSLFVPGADEDAKRTASVIKRLSSKISDIHITMDCHNIIDISHPIWWVDDNGNAPAPFTTISAADVEKGIWHTRQRNVREHSIKYLKALEAAKRYPHMIWPEHCIIGTWGNTLQEDFADAVHHWERTRYATANKITKGSNPLTEHFSAVRAEVPDPMDPTTQLNRSLVQVFETADMLVWTGEALSHCVANTFRDTIEAFSDPSIVKKMWLLTDTTSNVPGCESLGDTFIKDMTQRGLNLAKSTDFLI